MRVTIHTHKVNDKEIQKTACMRNTRNVHKLAVEKTPGKKPLVRRKCRWENHTTSEI
jgi:hypothetical protein